MAFEKTTKDVMMILGEYQFGIDTAAYQGLQHAANYRWQEQSRVRHMPAQQFIGVGSESININGMILPHFKGGLGQISEMRREARKGKPLLMTVSWLGRGRSLGRWCITTIEENQTLFSANGTPTQLEFSMSLISYGEDGALPNSRW